MAGRKFLPLAPPGRRDVWTNCSNFVPTRAGTYATRNTMATVAAVSPATPGTALRAWCALLADDTVVSYIGTTTKLWKYATSSTFTDLSRGGGYTNTATDWSFVQFGNRTLAANKIDPTQSRDATGAVAFADLAGAPKASILVTQALQILAFDINDGTDQPNAWAACAPGDYTDWSSAGATTATAILHRPGKITAAVAFRDYVLAFKRGSVYKLTYTGATFKWRVECIAINRGCWGKHDVVHCGDSVVFSGPGGAWSYDGSSFRAITDEYGEVPISVASFFAPISQNVWFLSLNGLLSTYNLVSDRWGNSSFAALTTSVMMTGEVGALSTLIAPTGGIPDLYYLFSKNNIGAVSKSSVNWATTAGDSATLRGSIEGLGGDRATRFGELQPQYVRTLTSTGSSITLADTALLMSVYLGNTLDADNLFSLSSPALFLSPSFSKTRRFAINKTAPYMIMQFILSSGTGYLEIMDYTVGMQPDGKQGA